MPEHIINQCLDLCHKAQKLEGDEQRHTLCLLQTALEEVIELLGTPSVPLNPAADGTTSLIAMDPAGYITSWNESAERLFGYTPEEAIGQHVLFLYAEDDNEIVELFTEPDGSTIEARRRKKSGEIFRVNMSLSLQRDDAGNPIGLIAQLSEITDRTPNRIPERATDHLSDEDKRRLHARIVEDSNQGILITDADERIVSVNAAFTRITGYSAAEVIGQPPDILHSTQHTSNFRNEIRTAIKNATTWHGEIVSRRKNGELFPQSVTISVIPNDNGDISHAFSIFTDISVHKETEARLQQLAHYDDLTGLPNRSLLDQLVGQALHGARRNHGYGALLIIGLLRFTAIHDTLGPEVSNALLCQVSQLLRQALRKIDVLARIDHHKFAVALLDIQKREHAGIVAQKLIAQLSEPIVIDTHKLSIGASIGIAVYPEDGMNTASLLHFAESAMTKLKKNGETGYMFYSPEMNQRAKEHLWFESELRHALTDNHLRLYYQPKVSLRSGCIVGAEALIRWLHPERGMIAPSIFITVAEETGLILDVGVWVLEEACRQIRQWEDALLDVPPIAVNLSSRQFDHKLPERIRSVLSRYNIHSERIKLEITESLLVHGPDKVIPIMNELVAMGMSLALDDFGTGYSSLAYLKKFPISTLKIDRSFVVGLPKDTNDCAIARAIVTMGQQLRQEIVAEGVETMEQMTFLRDLGCDQLQGYLFSPPVPASDFERMIRDRRRLIFNS